MAHISTLEMCMRTLTFTYTCIVFLVYHKINKLLLCKMHILSQRFHFYHISLLPDPISESKDQFRTTSSEMKLAVSAWVTIDQVLLNDHKWMLSANFLHINWTASSEFGTYRLCQQQRFRRACASTQSRQNLRCSLIQVVSQEEPSDRKPDP